MKISYFGWLCMAFMVFCICLVWSESNSELKLSTYPIEAENIDVLDSESYLTHTLDVPERWLKIEDGGITYFVPAYIKNAAYKGDF